MDQDRLGRRRRPDQERGLRPIHPTLPDRWLSRALRVAMSESDWTRFEALAQDLAHDAPTQARAYGQTISRLVHSVPPPEPRPENEPGPLDWMDWERRKTLRLLPKDP
jgi:hypothetical protein